MALKPGDRANFNTLLEAAKQGDLALMECTDAKTGEYRAVICAVNHDGTDHVMVPLGHIATGNPYEDYKPPDECDPDTEIVGPYCPWPMVMGEEGPMVQMEPVKRLDPS